MRTCMLESQKDGRLWIDMRWMVSYVPGCTRASDDPRALSRRYPDCRYRVMVRQSRLV
jgi:hypothetical protein